MHGQYGLSGQCRQAFRPSRSDPYCGSPRLRVQPRREQPAAAAAFLGVGRVVSPGSDEPALGARDRRGPERHGGVQLVGPGSSGGARVRSRRLRLAVLHVKPREAGRALGGGAEGVADTSHEDRRTLLRGENVSSQLIETWKTCTDPDFTERKNRGLFPYDIADGNGSTGLQGSRASRRNCRNQSPGAGGSRARGCRSAC